MLFINLLEKMFLLVFLVIVKACHMSPLIFTPDVYVLFGQPVNITCNVTSSWQTLKIDINNTKNVGYYSQKDNACKNSGENKQNLKHICRLEERIFGIGFEDIHLLSNNTNVTFTLTYKSEAETTTSTGTTRIIIEQVKATLTSNHMTVEENENITFQCEVTGAVSALTNVTWYKGTVPFTNCHSDDRKSRSKIVSKIQYSADLDDNEVVVYCSVNVSRKLVKSNNLTIIVGRGPVDVCIYPEQPTYVISSNGDMKEIFCRSNCTPSCSYKWFVSSNSSVIGEDSRFPYQEIGDDKIGKYHCLVTNPRTGKTKNTTLKIYNNQIVPDVIMTNTGLYNISENSSFVLPCLQPDITLLHDRSELEIKNLITQANAILSNNEDSTTVISNATCFDAGLYTCKSTNCYGDETLLKYNVDVLCHPYFLSGANVMEREINIGDSIDINVSFVGYPQPIVLLERTQNSTTKIQNRSFGFFIYESRQGIIYNTGLYKRHAEMDDSGTYSVEISNYLGKTKVYISVKVVAISFVSKRATMIGIIVICVMICITLITIARQFKRRVTFNDNQVRSDSVHYANAEAVLEEADGAMGYIFDDGYLYQNRIREIELRASEPYENLSITADNTSYEEVGPKPDLNKGNSQEPQRESDSRDLEINCNIRRGSDGYLFVTGLQPLEILSESENRQFEETSEERDSNEDAEGYIIMNVPRSALKN